MNAQEIVKKPLNTEKTTTQKELFNQVSFEVAKNANRIEIKRAVEEIFKVRVGSVNTQHVTGKKKRRGRIIGRQRDWKKAIVTLMPGERIDFFDGV